MLYSQVRSASNSRIRPGSCRAKSRADDASGSTAPSRAAGSIGRWQAKAGAHALCQYAEIETAQCRRSCVRASERADELVRAHDRPGQGGSKIRLANLAYNMRRFVWLGVRGAPALKEMDDGDGRRSLRVWTRNDPVWLSSPCDASRESADMCDEDPCDRAGDCGLEVLGEAAAATEPSESPFDDPAAR